MKSLEANAQGHDAVRRQRDARAAQRRSVHDAKGCPPGVRLERVHGNVRRILAAMRRQHL